MLSAEAQLTYHRAYVLAGSCDANGLLIKDDQPYTIDALYNPHVKKLDRAVAELQHKKDMDGLPWLRTSLFGSIEVVGWYADQISADTLRKRRKTTPEFPGVVNETGPENLGSILENTPEKPIIEKYREPPRDIKSLGGTAVAKNGSAPWVLALKADVAPLLDAALPTLTLEQRQITGRYLAFRVANCAVKEPSNVKMGRKFAGQIAEMSKRKALASVTVSEFLGAANRVWEASNRYPLYSLWEVFAAFEDEPK